MLTNNFKGIFIDRLVLSIIDGWIHFNNKTDLHLYKKLLRDHIYPKVHEKMRNHLAENVLNKDMLYLFTALQKSVGGMGFSGVTALLEQTSLFIEIFSSITSKIESVNDVCIFKLKDILQFFHNWESEYSDPKEKMKHLITRETW